MRGLVLYALLLLATLPEVLGQQCKQLSMTPPVVLPKLPCVQLDITKVDHPKLCHAFDARAYGTFQMGVGFDVDVCTRSGGLLMCLCDTCNLTDIVNTTKKLDGFNDLAEHLERCLTYKPSTTTWPTSITTDGGAYEYTTEGGDSDEPGSTQTHAVTDPDLRNRTHEITGTTNASIKEIEDLIKQLGKKQEEEEETYPSGPDPEYYGIEVLDEELHYVSEHFMFAEGGSEGIDEKRYALTPSTYFNPTKQNMVYGTGETGLLLIALAHLGYTIVVLRAVISATLYTIFPDYKFLA